MEFFDSLTAVYYEKSDILSKTYTPTKVDSLVKSAVDYRLTSYDNRFINLNSVVVNDKGEVIGKLYIQTTEAEIDSFYNQDPKWFKTETYKQLKSGKFNIITKE